VEADPVEGFFAGFDSAFSRILIAFGGVLAGSGICYLALATDDTWDEPIEWLLYLITLLPWWGTFGLWFFVGLAALFAILGSGLLFLQDRNSKLAFFGISSGAVVYFLPTCFRDCLWIRVVILYLPTATLYWYLSAAPHSHTRNRLDAIWKWGLWSLGVLVNLLALFVYVADRSRTHMDSTVFATTPVLISWGAMLLITASIVAMLCGYRSSLIRLCTSPKIWFWSLRATVRVECILIPLCGFIPYALIENRGLLQWLSLAEGAALTVMTFPLLPIHRPRDAEAETD